MSFYKSSQLYIFLLAIGLCSVACSSLSLTGKRSPSSQASSVTPEMVTQAYTAVSAAIQTMDAKAIDCGPGFDSSDTCYQGNDGCRVNIGYVSTGMFSVFVDAAQRPPYPAQCDMTLISPSHTIQSLTTATNPYVFVKAVTTTSPDTDDGPKTTDTCSIRVQQNIVTATTKDGSTPCKLGNE